MLLKDADGDGGDVDEELKQYLDAMERRTREHVSQECEKVESRTREHVSKECEKLETKLLTAFHGWARTM